LEAKDVEHAQLIRALEAKASDERVLPTDEFLQVPFEAFRDHLLQRLFPPPPPAPIPVQPERGDELPPRVYLVCGAGDLPFTKTVLRKELRALGVGVGVPLPPEDPEQDRERHEAEELRDADGVLIVWRSMGEGWVQQQLRRLRRFADLGRARALKPLGVLAADAKYDDPTDPGELFLVLEDNFDPAQFMPFLRQLGL
jgi:hypothetical protein